MKLTMKPLPWWFWVFLCLLLLSFAVGLIWLIFDAAAQLPPNN